MNTTLIGRWGEAEAAAYLEGKGYRILESNYRSRYGEIDLIAAKGNIVAFVEVKLRNNPAFATGAESVTERKIAKIVTTAGAWVVAHADEGWQPRFDVIEVTPTAGYQPGTAGINHIVNAFGAPGRD